MSKECSFDVVSEINIQEVDNAVQQAVKEILNRFDLKTSQSRLKFDRDKGEIELLSQDEYKLRSVLDIAQSKLVKRGISLKALQYGRLEVAPGGNACQRISLVQGIPDEKSREISKAIRSRFPKAKVQIMGDRVRVADKDRDTLQLVIKALRETDFGIPLQFVNYR